MEGLLPSRLKRFMVSVLMQEQTNRSITSLEAGDVLIVPPLGTFSSAAFD